MNYLDLLKKLLALGDKLPQVLDEIRLIVDAVKRIGELLGVRETFAAEAPTPEVLSLEAEVIAAASGSTAGTFAGQLSDLLDFIRSNRDLIALILKIIK